MMNMKELDGLEQELFERKRKEKCKQIIERHKKAGLPNPFKGAKKMKTKNVSPNFHLFSWWVISVLAFIIVGTLSFPTIGFFKFYFEWLANPIDPVNIIILILSFIFIPLIQLFWIIVLFSLFDPDKSFVKSFEENTKHISAAVKSFENNFRRSRSKK